jgi:pyridoxal phosphate enzyme (YggS family)
MHKILRNLQEIQQEIYLKNNDKNKLVKLIAVSKNFQMDKIKPLIENGHIHFGENKVQEAINKWEIIKDQIKDLKLHMIGRLQKNKVKHAVRLFDYIHSLDNLKLAEKISLEQKKNSKNLKIFIQINIGNEEQKNGIQIEQLENFYNICVKNLNLDIIGLMCIPPENQDVRPFFKKMKELNNNLGLKELSMGMSSDYLEAIKFGASFIRVGSKIFGKRY